MNTANNQEIAREFKHYHLDSNMTITLDAKTKQTIRDRARLDEDANNALTLASALFPDLVIAVHKELSAYKILTVVGIDAIYGATFEPKETPT